MSTPEDDDIYAGAPLHETDWLRIIRDTPMPPANPYDLPATKSQKSYLWDLGLRDKLKIDSLTKSQASALISAAIECRDEKEIADLADNHPSNKKSSGCFGTTAKMAFILVSGIFIFAVFMSFCSAPRSAPVASTPQPTATPEAAPPEPTPAPTPAPTPEPTPEPVSFQSGQQIITLEPVTLIGAQGSVKLPAGSRLTIQSTTADSATIHRGEFRATVPFSAIQPAE
jgi:hypothetical protein